MQTIALEAVKDALKHAQDQASVAEASLQAREVIVSALKTDGRVDHLHFANMNLTTTSLDEGEDKLSSEADVEVGTSEECESRINHIGMKILVAALQDVKGEELMPEITELDLAYNIIGRDGAMALADILKGFDCNITDLDLSGNAIGDDGMVAIANALETNQSIVSLQLAANSIGLRGVQALAAALRVNRALVSLDLGGNNIGNDGVQEICSALESNTSLKELSLYTTGLSSRGTDSIARLITTNKTLVELDLGSNALQDDGAKEIAEALHMNSALVTLDVQRSGFGKDGIGAFAEALQKNCTLQSLNLSSNNCIDNDETIEVICDALKVNDSLKKLDMRSSEPELTADGLQSLWSLLCRNRALTQLLVNIPAAVSEEVPAVEEQFRSLLSRNALGLRIATVMCSWTTVVVADESGEEKENDAVSVSCMDLAGTELAAASFDPFDDLTSLAALLTQKTGHAGHWQLIFPDSDMCPDPFVGEAVQFFEVA